MTWKGIIRRALGRAPIARAGAVEGACVPLVIELGGGVQWYRHERLRESRRRSSVARAVAETDGADIGAAVKEKKIGAEK